MQDIPTCQKSKQAQRSCRNLFKEAVAWAQQVIKDPVIKAAWQKKLRRPNRVYNEAIKQYIKKAKANIAAEQAVMRENTRTIHCNGMLCPSSSAAIRAKSKLKKSRLKNHTLSKFLMRIGLPKNYFGNNKKGNRTCKTKQGKFRSMIPGNIVGSNLRIVSEKYHSLYILGDWRVEVISSQRS